MALAAVLQIETLDSDEVSLLQSPQALVALLVAVVSLVSLLLAFAAPFVTSPLMVTLPTPVRNALGVVGFASPVRVELGVMILFFVTTVPLLAAILLTEVWLKGWLPGFLRMLGLGILVLLIVMFWEDIVRPPVRYMAFIIASALVPAIWVYRVVGELDDTSIERLRAPDAVLSLGMGMGGADLLAVGTGIADLPQSLPGHQVLSVTLYVVLLVGLVATVVFVVTSLGGKGGLGTTRRTCSIGVSAFLGCVWAVVLASTIVSLGTALRWDGISPGGPKA